MTSLLTCACSIVVKDENKFTADAMQGLVHALCYSYARATKAVSVSHVTLPACRVMMLTRLDGPRCLREWSDDVGRSCLLTFALLDDSTRT